MPTHGPDLSKFNLTQLRALTGHSERVIRRRLGDLEPVERDGRTVWYAARPALERIYLGESLDLTRERAKLARAQSAAQEMRNAVSRAELIPAADVELVGTALLSAVKMRVMGLSTLASVVRAAGDDAEGAAILESGAHEALSELAGMGDLARRAAARKTKGAA